MLRTLPHDVTIAVSCGKLNASFHEPAGARGLIIFAHGSGSSRLSPRNLYVADRLHQEGFGTLLLDLLTESEDRNDANRFDIQLLATRLEQAVAWAKPLHVGIKTPLALFGASTGAAAALVAAAHLGNQISAVVSRGGRPDLAGNALIQVQCPTLLIVGELDTDVLQLNRAAMARMEKADVGLTIVPGATHLFAEPGTLEKTAGIAVEWFLQHASG